MQTLPSQQGFSLLELLIALLILGVSLLGLAKVEIFTLRDTQAAYFQSIAYLQATEIVERLRSCDHTGLVCFKQERLAWQNSNKSLLPQANSRVELELAHCKVNLQWTTIASQQPKAEKSKIVINTQL